MASSEARVRLSGAAPLVVEQLGFEPGQDAQILGIALESAEVLGELVECTLAVVAVRRVPDIVCESGEFDEVGLAAQTDRDAAADLSDLQ